MGLKVRRSTTSLQEKKKTIVVILLYVAFSMAQSLLARKCIWGTLYLAGYK